MRDCRLTRVKIHTAGGLVLSAFVAWLGSIAISVVADVIRLALGLDSLRLLISDRTDAVFPVVVVTATAWLFLNRHQEHLSQVQLLGVGIFWVSLSLLASNLYGLYISGHCVARFLVKVFTGSDDAPGGWMWGVFLAAELITPPTVGSLRELRSRKHGGRTLRSIVS